MSLDHKFIRSDGESTATARVTLSRYNGAGVPDQNISFTGNGGQTFGPVTYKGGGVYEAQVTSSTTPGKWKITATSGSLSASSDLEQVPQVVTQVKIKFDPDTVPAEHTSVTTATITATDADGNGVAGRTPTLTRSGGQTWGPVTDNGDGTYTVTVHSSDENLDGTITATIDGISGSAVLHQTPLPAATLTVTFLYGQVTADGSAGTAAYVHAYSANGAEVPTDGVTVTTDGAQTVGTIVPDGRGAAVWITSSKVAGPVKVTAKLPSGLEASATFDQLAGGLDHIRLWVDPNPIVADGHSTTTLKAAYVDAVGNPVVVPDDPTWLMMIGGPTGWLPASGPDAKGVWSITLTSTTTPNTSDYYAVAQVFDYASDWYGSQWSDWAQFKTVAGPAKDPTLTLSPDSLTADGAATTTATLVAKDANGNPVTGKAPTFTSDGGQSIGPVSEPTPGTYKATITATQAVGLAKITATIGDAHGRRRPDPDRRARPRT